MVTKPRQPLWKMWGMLPYIPYDRVTRARIRPNRDDVPHPPLVCHAVLPDAAKLEDSEAFFRECFFFLQAASHTTCIRLPFVLIW